MYSSEKFDSAMDSIVMKLLDSESVATVAIGRDSDLIRVQQSNRTARWNLPTRREQSEEKKKNCPVIRLSVFGFSLHSKYPKWEN